MCAFNGQGFEQDIAQAMDYVEKARPVIEQLLKGRMVAVEGDTNEICQMLDKTCGTDYFQVYEEHGLVWGVASRMQEIDTARFKRPFNTFTVRKGRKSGAKTEYEKRKDAIKNGGVYPYLTMQGYFDKQDGHLMSLGIARTVDIMEFIDSGHAETRRTGWEQSGQAEFYVVRWEDFKQKYKLCEYSA